MIKRNILSEIQFYENIQKCSIECDEELVMQEKQARDRSFTLSPAMSFLEGWMWNICWSAAKEYYQKGHNA